MSDVTTSVPTSQVESTPTVPTPPADTTPETTATEPQDDAAATVADVASGKGLATANRTLDKFRTLCQRLADQNYALGETAALYVGQYLGASDKSTRSRAVENLAAEWLQWDEDSLSLPLAKAKGNMLQRVQRLLRVNAVRVLMGDGRDVAKGDGTKDGRGKGKKGNPIPWAKLLALAPLVDRDPADNVESWAPLSDAVLAKGTALVAEIAASGLNRDDVYKAVRVIVAEHYTARVEELRAIAAEQPGNRNAQLAVERAQKQAAAWVDKVAKDAPKPPAVEPVQPTEEDDDDGEGDDEPEAKAEPQPRAHPLASMVRAATAKDAAESIRDGIDGHEEPDTLVYELLVQLGQSAELSPNTRQMCADAAEALREDSRTVSVSALAVA